MSSFEAAFPACHLGESFEGVVAEIRIAMHGRMAGSDHGHDHCVLRSCWTIGDTLH